MNIPTYSTKNNHAVGDFKAALRSWRVWVSLGMQDILLRYRGSVLGPFWITISTAITVYSMGFLYGTLFGIDRVSYLPYFTTGMIAWNFISMIVNESSQILLESKHYMENIRLPCVVYVFRLILRNTIIFVHNLPVYLSVLLIYPVELNANILLLIPGLMLLCINGIFYGTILAFISARFPDVKTIITNILQIFFFITPIMWTPSALPSRFHLFLTLNPFVYFVNLIRNPLLGLSYAASDLIATAILTLSGMMIFALVIQTYRKRVIFWL